MDSCPWDTAGDSSDDDMDDWFHTSITRYSELLMYSLDLNPVSMDVSGNGRVLAVAGSSCKKSEKSGELIVLSVPKKLNSTSNETEIMTSRDFTLKAGAFPDNIVSQLKFWDSSDKLLTSGVGEPGITCWATSQEEDLLKSLSQLESSSLTTPKFDVTCHLSCLSDGRNVETADLSVWKTSDRRRLEGGRGEVTEVVCESESISWVCLDSGQIYRLDRRVEGPIKVVTSLADESTTADNFYSGPEIWYTTLSKTEETPFGAGISCGGLLRLVDFRNKKTTNQTLKENGSGHKLRFGAENCLSIISGDTVSVYSLKDHVAKFQFRHDGHRRKLALQVLESVWHPMIDDLVFSVDSRRNLHAWRYRL